MIRLESRSIHICIFFNVSSFDRRIVEVCERIVEYCKRIVEVCDREKIACSKILFFTIAPLTFNNAAVSLFFLYSLV